MRQAMRKFGYRPNLLARSFRRQETKTIALLIPDNSNIFWAEMARVIEQSGYAYGYTVLLCNSDWSPECQRNYVDTLIAKPDSGSRTL